jgi:hypothetical protein
MTELQNRHGLSFDLAAGRRVDLEGRSSREIVIDDERAGITDFCEGDIPTTKDRCLKLTRLVAESAIIYNTETLQKVSSGYYDTTYGFGERKDCGGTNRFVASARVSAANDADGDKVDDCKIKWKRNYSAMFKELKLDEQGMPSNETGMTVAVTGAHLAVRGLLKNDQTNTDLKRGWTQELASDLRRGYPSASMRSLGGDFNIARCGNKRPSEPGDWPEEDEPPQGEGCETEDWWTGLSDGVREPLLGSFGITRWRQVPNRDSVHTIHGTQDDRLVGQYRDGCIDIDANTGSCIVSNSRTRRIDYIFGALLPVIASSHDLTCGMESSSTFDPNCTDVRNPQRYSDHRLVWSLLGRE